MPKHISLDNVYFDYTIESASRPGIQHVVSWGANRYGDNSGHNDLMDWSCTCEDWNYRCQQHGGVCKHIRYVASLSPEDGGPVFWEETDGDPVLILPRFDDVLLLMVAVYFNPGGKLWGDCAIIHAADSLMRHCQSYVPVWINDELIPAVLLPDTVAESEIINEPPIMVYPNGDVVVVIVRVPITSPVNNREIVTQVLAAVESDDDDADISTATIPPPEVKTVDIKPVSPFAKLGTNIDKFSSKLGSAGTRRL